VNDGRAGQCCPQLARADVPPADEGFEFCEGFRMPAHHRRHRALRGRVYENLQGRKPRWVKDVGAARSNYGDFSRADGGRSPRAARFSGRLQLSHSRQCVGWTSTDRRNLTSIHELPMRRQGKTRAWTTPLPSITASRTSWSAGTSVGRLSWCHMPLSALNGGVRFDLAQIRG
jgi:hypothetical protein